METQSTVADHGQQKISLPQLTIDNKGPPVGERITMMPRYVTISNER